MAPGVPVIPALYAVAMGDRSSIEWTQATWNPTTGCDRTSPGCENCYALTLAGRLKAMGQAKYQRDGNPRTSGPGFRLTMHHDALDVPKRWRAGRLVFVNSMSDLFHPDVSVDFVQRVLGTMRETPQHRYQILTKRSRRLVDVDAQLEWPANAWVGVSIESQRYAFRAAHLARTRANVRFLSLEPLLGPIRELDLKQIDWVIARGESGHNARPVNIEWLRGVRDMCVEAGVPFFFKQWGGRTPKAGGRELDGRVWDEMPVRSTA